MYNCLFVSFYYIQLFVCMSTTKYNISLYYKQIDVIILYMGVNMNVAELLKHYRKQAGLTQKQLAERLNITQQNLSVYESGKRKPKIDTLKRFSAALDIPYTELLKAWQPDLNIDPVDAAFIDYFTKIDNSNGLNASDRRALEHFRPLSDTNKDKAIDFMDYLKSKQDPEG